MSIENSTDFRNQKEEIIKYAEAIYKETFEANSYFLIIKQFDKYINKYHDEIEISSAFYTTVYLSLQNSCMLLLSKIYENDDTTVSLHTLLKIYSENIYEFQKNNKCQSLSNNVCNKKKYNYYLNTDEERFFEKELKMQKSFNELFQFNSGEKPIYNLELPIEDVIKLFKKSNNSLNKVKENLRIQRNKIYVHNDKNGVFNYYDILNENPINYNDIEMLISFAFRVTRFIIGAFTGIQKPIKCVNIDDWEGTLKLVQLGSKYLNQYANGELL